MSVTKTLIIGFFVFLAAVILFQSLRLLMLKQSVSNYKVYWDKQALKPAESSAITYVALGDSAAQGIGASSPRKGYVGLLAESLSKKYDRPVRVINLSVSGAKVNDVIRDQLPKLEALNLPDDTIITLEIGANDMGNFNAADFKNQFETVLARLPSQTVVSDIPYFGGGRAKSKEPNAVTASAVIAQAVQKANLRLAPLYATTKTGDSFWTSGADFFHASDTGYKNWHKAFAGALGL